jgi:hypothetical protein
MAMTRDELRSQARGLGALAEGVLRRDLPLNDRELAYLVGVVEFTDEFLG